MVVFQYLHGRHHVPEPVWADDHKLVAGGEAVVADLRQRSQVWRCLHRKQLKGLSHEMDLAFDDMMITVVKGLKRVRAHCLIFF